MPGSVRIISGTAIALVAAAAWVGLLWQQVLSGSQLILSAADCRAPTGNVTAQVLSWIAVVLGTAILSAANAFSVTRFPDAWWITIVRVLLFSALVLGLVAMAWLTVLIGAMWISNDPPRPAWGAIILGWLLAPLLISLAALLLPEVARPTSARTRRLVAMSASLPVVLYGVGLAVTIVLQALRCGG